MKCALYPPDQSWLISSSRALQRYGNLALHFNQHKDSSGTVPVWPIERLFCFLANQRRFFSTRQRGTHLRLWLAASRSETYPRYEVRDTQDISGTQPRPDLPQGEPFIPWDTV
jgi:hypothetical protein